MRAVNKAGVVGLTALAIGLSLASPAVSQSFPGSGDCPTGSTPVSVNQTVTTSGGVAVGPTPFFTAKTVMTVTRTWSSGPGTWRLVNNTGGASDPITVGSPGSNPAPFNVNDNGTMYASLVSGTSVTVIGFCYSNLDTAYPVQPAAGSLLAPLVLPSQSNAQPGPPPAPGVATTPPTTAIPSNVAGVQVVQPPAPTVAPAVGVEVEGSQLTAPVAFTGFNSGALVRLGAASAVFGAAMVLVARRRRRPTTV